MIAENEIPIIALDKVNLSDVAKLVRMFADRVYAFKVHTLYDRYGELVFKTMRNAGAKKIWLDRKLLDIPETVEATIQAFNWPMREWGVIDIFSVHARGGVQMMKSAVAADASEIYAVTHLTSEGMTSFESHWSMVKDVQTAGVKTVVCSGRMARVISGVEIVSPGTRLVSSGMGPVVPNSHAMQVTPAEAINNGATRLVWGREIAQSQDPMRAFEEHMESVRIGLKNRAATRADTREDLTAAQWGL